MKTVVSLIAFFIAVLSGMGIGGGGLLVVFLSLATDMPQFTVQGLNLLFFLFSSAASLFVHMRKRKLFGTVILTMSLCGMAASPLGTLIAGALPSDILRRIFGLVLILSGLLSARRILKTKKQPKSKKILP